MSSNNSWELARAIAGENPGLYPFAKQLFIGKIRGMLANRGVHPNALYDKAADAFMEAVIVFLPMWKKAKDKDKDYEQSEMYKEEGKFISFFMRLASCAEHNRYTRDKKNSGDIVSKKDASKSIITDKKDLGKGDGMDLIKAYLESLEGRDHRCIKCFFLDPEHVKRAEVVKEKMRIIHRYLPSLSANQRQVLESYYFEGDSLQKIADDMGKSLTNIKQMNRNAKRRLQQLCLLDSDFQNL